MPSHCAYRWTSRPRAGATAAAGLAARAALAVAVVAVVAAGAAGCSLTPSMERPDEATLRTVLLPVLGAASPEALRPEQLAVIDREGDAVVYRTPTADEMSQLWLMPPIDDFTIGEVRCQYHPVWRIAFRPKTAAGEGPPLVAEALPQEGGWRVLMRWREARPDESGRLVPDFTPHGANRATSLEGKPKVMVLAQPPWTDLRMESP